MRSTRGGPARTTARLLVLGLVLWLPTVAACGGRPPAPPRGVVEADLEGWRFRRFQGPLLDVEVWIDGNHGQAYSASYITASAEARGRVEAQDLVNVTVTRYERGDGVVRETVELARRLAAEKGYQVEESKLEGVRVLMITAPGEAWAIWPSARHVVKVGAQGRSKVPSSMVEHYGERYPSRLPAGSLEGPLPPGPEGAPRPRGDEPYDPANPRPNLDRYEPEKVKLPSSRNK